jgi:hypothetical protein
MIPRKLTQWSVGIPILFAPGTVQHATTAGSSTFASVYQNTIPNGAWSLYFDQTTHYSITPQGAVSWCMNFTENPVTVSVTESHLGSSPSNQGDPDNTDSHALTVTDTLDPAFAYAGFSGTDWSCTANLQVVTCVNHDAIASTGSPASYPLLTINVNVSPTATSPISNPISVIGGGVTTSVPASDSITIYPAPVLSVTKSHTGAFTQGQTTVWNITVNNTAANSVTGGTTNLSDTLPNGYTVSSFTGTGWSCPGAVGSGSLACASSQVVAQAIAFVVSVFASEAFGSRCGRLVR